MDTIGLKVAPRASDKPPTIEEAVARVREFIRQHAGMRGVHPDLAYTVWTDTKAEAAELRLSDLRVLVEIAK